MSSRTRKLNKTECENLQGILNDPNSCLYTDFTDISGYTESICPMNAIYAHTCSLDLDSDSCYNSSHYNNMNYQNNSYNKNINNLIKDEKN